MDLRRIIFVGCVCVGLLLQSAPVRVLAFDPPASVLELQRILQAERDRTERIREESMRLDAEEAAREAARLRQPVTYRPGVNGIPSKAVSRNFEVTAPTRAIGEKVCAAAEAEWAKGSFPNLFKPCQIRVRVGQIGAGGATTFSFGGGEVFGFDMTVQGSLERVLDSVIPHEVCHMKTACDTRRPLPRWADEGIATLFEEESERRRQFKLAEEVLGTNREIPIGELLRITEYPKNMQHVLTLYAEGAMLTEFLINRAAKAAGEQWTQEKAREWMVRFLNDEHNLGWDAAIFRRSRELGGVSNVAQLSNEFNKWMKSGKAGLYTFKEIPLSNPIFLDPNQILPVNNIDQSKYVTPLSR